MQMGVRHLVNFVDVVWSCELYKEYMLWLLQHTHSSMKDIKKLETQLKGEIQKVISWHQHNRHQSESFIQIVISSLPKMSPNPCAGTLTSDNGEVQEKLWLLC